MSYVDPAVDGTPAPGGTVKSAWGKDVQQDVEYLEAQSAAYVPAQVYGGKQSANFTAATGTIYEVDTAITVTLPLNPAVGALVTIVNIYSVYVTVAAGAGQIIKGGGGGTGIDHTSITIPPHNNDNQAIAVTLQAINSTTWVVVNTALNDASLGLTLGGGLWLLAGVTVQPQAISSNYTLTGSDQNLNVSAAVTLTVGPNVVTGQLVYITNTSTGTVTLTCPGTGTIDGVARSLAIPAGTGLAFICTTGLSANPAIVTTRGGFSAPSQVGVDMASGNWYAPSGDGAVTQANGIILYMPIVVTRSGTVSGMAVNVTSAGSTGSVVRMGIYADNAGKPGTLVKDAGTIATTTTGVAYIGFTQALTPGRYWLCAVGQGAPVTTPTLTSLAHTPMIISDTAADVFTGAPGWYGTPVTGALPGTATVSGTGDPVYVVAMGAL